MAAVLLTLTVILSLAGSEWIDSLYYRERSILSFPAAPRSAWRLPLLIVGFGGASLWMSCTTFSLAVLTGKLCLAYFLFLTLCTDWEQQLIFDRMQLAFALLTFLFIPCPEWHPLNHFLAALLGGGGFLLLALVTGGGVGGGDIKFMAVLGLWLGTAGLFDVVLKGFILSGLVAIIMLLGGQWRRNDRLAYSPYFSVAAIYHLL